ncbi:MAG: diguanylate cyclase [Fimbriimonadaceae bacterium]
MEVAKKNIEKLEVMRKLSDLNLNRLIVPSSSDMGSALIAMQKASASAAGVMHEKDFLGFITIESAILSEPDTSVKDFLRSASIQLHANELVRSASKKFVQQQADFLAVFDGEDFVGLVSALMLITELGRSYDPLTGLSWSDALRDWGVDRLEMGQEVCVVFFDLDDFGIYNKRYGHVIGDSVLKEFGSLLVSLIDPAKDILVRYGGDEFAMASVRTEQQVKEALKKLDSRQFNMKAFPAPVRFSYGISGGKRTIEPSRDHVAATLDNLISLASKDCIANKPIRETVKAVTHQVEQAITSPDWMQIARLAAERAGEASDADIRVIDALFVLAEGDQQQVVVTGVSTINGHEQAFRSVKPLGSNLEKAISEAVWDGAILS